MPASLPHSAFRVPHLLAHAICVSLLAIAARAADFQLPPAPDIPGATVRPNDIALPDRPALRWSWHIKEHLCGIVHPQQMCTLIIDVQNPTALPLTAQGTITISAEGKAVGEQTIAPTAVAPARTIAVEMPLHLTVPGTYHIACDHTALLNLNGLPLQSIFAPRATPAQSPLCTPLFFPGALVPGVLEDFVKQTSCRRFVLTTPWALAARDVAGEMLPLNTARTIAARVAAAHAEIILRVAPEPGFLNSPRDLAAFHDALSHLLPILHPNAIVLAPESDSTTPAAAIAYRSAYLAAYDAARRTNFPITFLGPGSASAARALLALDQSGSGASFAPFLDALAVADDPADLALAETLHLNKPLDVLPPAHDDALPTAVALVASAATVPLAPLTRGVPMHLLGNAVLYQTLTTTPTLIATFQGDGYAVGIVFPPPPKAEGSPSAAPSQTPPDAATPTTPPLTPLRPLTLLDSEGLMKVVDARGLPVDCRTGDSLKLPLDRGLLYVLVTGSAEDLTATFRGALAN
jgi:hypothetical protein